MPITNYATEISPTPNRIDLATFQSQTKMTQGSTNLASDTLSASISRDAFSWKVIEVGLQFSNATARAYSISKLRGARIVAGKNDRLWVGIDNGGIEPITLTPGFYATGTALATEIQTQLNANTTLASTDTFVVAYSTLYRNITITTVAGTANIKVFEEETSQSVRRHSTAAPTLGFTADTAWHTSVGAQSKILIGKDLDYALETASTDLDVIYNDEFDMDLDSALVLSAASGPAVVVDWYVLYQDIVPIL